MNNKKIYQSSDEEYLTQVKGLLANKQVLAWLLKYVVPAYHDLSIDFIAKQINCIKAHKKRWYDITCEMPIRGEKGGLVLFIAGNGSSVDDYNEGEHPFGSNAAEDYHVPRIIHMVTLKHKANDPEIGHDKFYTIIEELPSKQSEVSKQQSLGNCVFNFAEINFNQKQKLDGVHRILQIIFSNKANKENLLKSEFGIQL